MVTGYEVDMYHDIRRIREAAEGINKSLTVISKSMDLFAVWLQSTVENVDVLGMHDKEGLVGMHLRTRHPEHFVLTNVSDGTRWVIGENGQWVAAEEDRHTYDDERDEAPD